MKDSEIFKNSSIFGGTESGVECKSRFVTDPLCSVTVKRKESRTIEEYEFLDKFDKKFVRNYYSSITKCFMVMYNSRLSNSNKIDISCLIDLLKELDLLNFSSDDYPNVSNGKVNIPRKFSDIIVDLDKSSLPCFARVKVNLPLERFEELLVKARK